MEIINCKGRLFVKKIIKKNYCNIGPAQQHRYIWEKYVPYAPPLDCQGIYDFAQDGAPNPNLYTMVHKHSRKVPVEPDQSNEHQAFDEMPTSSAADSTQHYTVIYNRDGNRSGRPAPVRSTGRSGCRSGQDSSTGRSSRLKNQSNSPFWQLKDI